MYSGFQIRDLQTCKLKHILINFKGLNCDLTTCLNNASCLLINNKTNYECVCPNNYEGNECQYSKHFWIFFYISLKD